MKNNTFDGLRRVCKLKTEMYTIDKLFGCPFRALARFSEPVCYIRGPCDLQVQLVIIIQQTSNNKVSFLVANV